MIRLLVALLVIVFAPGVAYIFELLINSSDQNSLDWRLLIGPFTTLAATLIGVWVGTHNIRVSADGNAKLANQTADRNAELAKETADRNATTAANTRKLEQRLKYVETQLEKLYGPLLAECIEADSMFRRVELAMETLKHTEHRHYDLRSIRSSDFKDAEKVWEKPYGPTHCQFFARMLIRVFLPLNAQRIAILKDNLHLLGPAPPTSIYLFMTHAAQLRSIVEVKRHTDLDFNSVPDPDHNRYNDPYILTPFPSLLTGEVVAKVALLKAIQREHQYRLADPKRTEVRVFRREHYYLLLEKELWAELAKATDDYEKDRLHIHRAHYAPTFPLVWGPYTAVELFELRSWLISRERSVRKMDGLKAECVMFRAMLRAEVATINRGKVDYMGAWTITAAGGEKGLTVIRPLSHRVAQMFDELDDPGSKVNHLWDEKFEWEYLDSEYSHRDHTLQAFTLCGFMLASKTLERNLSKAEDIAYYADVYKEMREDGKQTDRKVASKP